MYHKNADEETSILYVFSLIDLADMSSLDDIYLWVTSKSGNCFILNSCLSGGEVQTTKGQINHHLCPP